MKNNLSRRERIRLSKTEKKVTNAIALPISLVVLVGFYLIRLLVLVLYRSKRNLARLAIVIFMFYSAYQTLLTSVIAPKPAHAMDGVKPQVAIVKTSERQQIDAYINQVFGVHAADFNLVLDCENNARNPYVINTNTDIYGSKDYGIAQINDHWQGVTNVAFLTDWRINIDMAWNIYKNHGYSFNAWTCGRKLGL